MKNWKAILGVLLVFALGVAAGAFGTIGVVRHRVTKRGPQVMADFIVRRLSWRLRLDRQQRTELRAIVDDSWQQVRAARQQVQPQVETILSNSEAKVRAILRPGQREKFDEIVVEREARWRQEQSP